MPTAKRKPKAKPKARTKKATQQDKTAAALKVFQQRYATLRAKYDAAQTNDDNRRHWANADGLSAADANSAAIRQTLRSRSRYEADNNGFYSGIIRTRADDLVGTGPTLQIPIEDDKPASAVETAFAKWFRAVSGPGKLHTMDIARFKDGETFAVLATNPAVDDAVQLDIFLVEADRVADPVARFDDSPGDGIEYDRFGNPTRYKVLRHHPNSTFSFSSAEPEFDSYFADQVCHWFRRERPGQLRGIPELTASLPIMPVMRRWTLATVFAAEMAANFAVILETQANPDSETQDPTPFETLELERNMMTALPVGVTGKQMAAEHPNAEFQNFQWSLLMECVRPIRMPVNVAAGDTSRANFASAKIDHLGYRAGLRVDRSGCETQVLNRIYRAWFAEARLIPGYLPAEVFEMELPHQWTWPGWLSWDKNEAAQDTEMLNNNTTTLAELLSEAGLDWRDVLRQRAKELELMKQLGITPASVAAPAPPAVGNAAPKEEKEKPEDEQKAAKRFPNRLNGHLNGNGVGHG